MPIKDNKVEPLPSVAAAAPTLIEAAGITEEKLQVDLRPYEADEPVEPEIPAHHLQACYESMVRGATVVDAARIANVPVSKAQDIADEIAAVRGALASQTPVKRGTVVEAPVEAPVEEEQVG